MREPTADGISVAVTCRVLDIARRPYCRWRALPITVGELEVTHRANALLHAHRGDLQFGYRVLVEEARDAGLPMADRTTSRTWPTRW